MCKKLAANEAKTPVKESSALKIGSMQKNKTKWKQLLYLSIKYIIHKND